MRLELVPRARVWPIARALSPLVAIIFAGLMAALVIAMMGRSPLAAFDIYIREPLGDSWALQEMGIKMIPLTLIATGLPKIHFWRDKQQREVDFVVPRSRDVVDAIECKWDAARFDPKSFQVFRALHPTGKNLVVATNVPTPHTRKIGGLTVTFTGLDALAI